MTNGRGKATIVGLAATLVLGTLVLVGSNNLRHIDAVLVGYTFATLFAAFGIAYRYVMWLERPPTKMYWRRGRQAFYRPGHILETFRRLVGRLVGVFALNRFIYRRSLARGLTHSLIMWGCVVAAAVTFPLVFGWVHFETTPGDLTRYQVFVFGMPTQVFPIDSLFGFLLFHALVWASLLVIPGVMLAMHRRLRDRGAAALQDFREDLLPLILLFAVSVTGLMLTVSYTWMKGYAYEFLAILHAITVIYTLLWLPFGKFFHIFQRPAQLGVKFYQDAGKAGEQADCKRCKQPFASKMHVDDLIAVEQQLGYRYDLPGDAVHYQHVCPSCRRKMLGLSQDGLWAAVPNGD
jgi:hypothetical protein